jgi:hypothetical protein
LFSFTFMCNGDVAMKVWMRGRFAAFSACPARSMSARAARARLATIARLALFRNRLHGLEIAFRCNGEARLDDVYAQRFQLGCNAQLFFQVHGAAGRLLAVAQGGVEDQDLLSVVLLMDKCLAHIPMFGGVLFGGPETGSTDP